MVSAAPGAPKKSTRPVNVLIDIPATGPANVGTIESGFKDGVIILS